MMKNIFCFVTTSPTSHLFRFNQIQVFFFTLIYVGLWWVAIIFQKLALTIVKNKQHVKKLAEEIAIMVEPFLAFSKLCPSLKRNFFLLGFYIFKDKDISITSLEKYDSKSTSKANVYTSFQQTQRLRNFFYYIFDLLNLCQHVQT